MEAKENMVGMTRGVVQEEGGNNTVTVHASKQADQEVEEGVQLLPGIPNEITINHIAPKLPWTAFHILSSISRGWQQAIQSHQVYDARVRSKSTQTLVACTDRLSEDDLSTIALFSMEDGSWYHLPPLPSLDQGIPWSSECVSLDGKLYVLGGSEDEDCASAEVYVFDLAGQRKWEQCASMENAREQFGCDVKDGKIYVFGGSFGDRPVFGSEVYDPDRDAWTAITPAPSFWFNHKVTTVGEELFLHNGNIYESDFTGDPDGSNDDDSISYRIQDAHSAEVFHPVKDEWRTVECFSRGRVEVLLMVGGKLHKLTSLGIQVYDHSADSWNPPQPFSFVGHKPSHSFRVEPLTAVAVDGEVLAFVYWINRPEEYNEATDGECLIKSKGVGGQNGEIVWQKLQCSLSLENDPLLCTIEV